MLSPGARDRGPPPRHSLLVSGGSSIRCFLSTPFAVLTFVLVTIFFFYLLWTPIFAPIGIAHGLRIDLPKAEHPHAGVLVGREHDLAEVATWTAFSHHHHQQPLPNRPDPSTNRSAAAPFSCYGVHSQRGRRPSMEDTYAVYLNHQLHYSSATQRHLMSVDTEAGESETSSPWALFGVFDGHGGKLAAEYTAAYLLPMLHSSLMHHGHSGIAESLPLPPVDTGTDSPPQANVTECFQKTFQNLDDEFIEEIARPDQLPDGSTALVAGVYYRSAPLRTDTEEGRPAKGTFQLVVANLGDCRAILIRPGRPAAARAPGMLPEPTDVGASPPSPSVITLSVDHKPHDPVERLYIESHPGGFITQPRRGPSRVLGVLATSRAIGDMQLKPYVRNRPDVRIVDLDDWHETKAQPHTPERDLDSEDSASHADSDRCPFEAAASLSDSQCDFGLASGVLASDLLLLASDGFWDVFTNEEAAEATTAFLAAHEDEESAVPSSSPSAPLGASPPPSPSVSPPLFSWLAHHLTKAAYLRGSTDNITVMVVQLECIKRWIRQTTSTTGKRADAKPDTAMDSA